LTGKMIGPYILKLSAPFLKKLFVWLVLHTQRGMSPCVFETSEGLSMRMSPLPICLLAVDNRQKPASRLLLVCLRQFAQGLSDEHAAEAVRGRLDWKYMLSLELTDPGFDASVLCEFRHRLLEGKADPLILQPWLDLALARGWLKGRGKQRTDSTHVFGAIRTRHRLESVGETMRATLNVVATVAPEWLRTQVSEAWVDRYEKGFEGYCLPKGKAERKQDAEVIGTDGLHLLSALYSETAPPGLREVPMVQVLRQVWVQQYYAPDGPAAWRTEGDLPPSA
jgi:transposase